MKYYKCVSKDMESLVVSPKSVLHVKYKEDEWIKPNVPGTKLMAFDNLADARHFRPGYCIIYECKVKNPLKQQPNTFVDWGHVEWCSMRFDVLMRLKKNKKKYLQQFKRWSNTTDSDTPKIPYGTVFCDEIKLTKRISKNYP